MKGTSEGLRRFTLAADDETFLSSLGFRLVATDVDLTAIDLASPAIVAFKDRKSVYYWLMRFECENYKIYVGKTNSLPRRLREYSSKFQPGVPNDYKLRHFQSWCQQRLPGFALDLYAVQRDDHQAVETEVWRRTRPLMNDRAGVPSKDLQDSHFEYYRRIFDAKLNQRDGCRVIDTPARKPAVKLAPSTRRAAPPSNHDKIALAMKGHVGRELETRHIADIVLAAFPDFNVGSLLPNDHAEGNKGACPCAATESRLFDRKGRGLYRVR